MVYIYWSAKDDMASDAERTKLKTLLWRTFAIYAFSIGLVAYPLLQEHYLVLIAFAVSQLFLIFEQHRTMTVSSGRSIFNLAVAVCMLLLIQWCLKEPYIYDGLMYNRKWCGVASDADQRCNAFKN